MSFSGNDWKWWVLLDLPGGKFAIPGMSPMIARSLLFSINRLFEDKMGSDCSSNICMLQPRTVVSQGFQIVRDGLVDADWFVPSPSKNLGDSND